MPKNPIYGNAESICSRAGDENMKRTRSANAPLFGRLKTFESRSNGNAASWYAMTSLRSNARTGGRVDFNHFSDGRLRYRIGLTADGDDQRIGDGQRQRQFDTKMRSLALLR